MEKKNKKAKERGSGSILALAIIAVVLVIAVGVAGLIGVVTANQRATSAADLAALAGADTVRGLRSGDPCGVARNIAEANRAQLTGCALPQNLSGTLDIRVEVPIAGPFAFLGSAESLSRAGPPGRSRADS